MNLLRYAYELIFVWKTPDNTGVLVYHDKTYVWDKRINDYRTVYYTDVGKLNTNHLKKILESDMSNRKLVWDSRVKDYRSIPKMTKKNIYKLR